MHQPVSHPPADHAAAVQLRLLDPGGDTMTFTWQVLGHGHLLATGKVAGAPNTPDLAGWRYQAFTEAAQAAIAALQDLEAATRPPVTVDHAADRTRICDFCAAARAAWRYPVRPGQAVTIRTDDTLVLLPGGAWHACPACHALVEAGTWDTLSERAQLPADQGGALWAAFRAVRAGPALPLDHREGRADA